MRSFTDQAGQGWIAIAREEETPRHHGRWYLLFKSEGTGAAPEFPLTEIRWQTRETAERTIRTMSEKELNRRLAVALARAPRAVTENATAA